MITIDEAIHRMKLKEARYASIANIKTKIKPEFFAEVADVLESIERGKNNETSGSPHKTHLHSLPAPLLPVHMHIPQAA